MADVQIAVIDQEDTQLALAVPGVQGPIGLTGSVTIAQAGTAATPGIRFESDTNTGIYSPGADQLAVSTGGTGRLFIDGNGNVGVGTSAPVSNSVTLSRASGYVEYRVASASNSASLSVDGSVAYLGTNNSLAQLFITNGTERMRLDSSGRLGIGTSSPGSILDVKVTDSNTTIGGSASVIRVNNGSGILGSTSGLEFFHGNDTSSNVARLAGVYGRYSSFNASGLGGELVFATNTAGDSTIDERMRITSTGNVGIGTSSPITLLDVAGSARIGAAAGDITLEVGAGASGNRSALIDLTGDTTYSDYGLRIIRGNSGANTDSKIQHRGTGSLIIEAQEAAPTTFFNGGTERLRIDSSGRLLVGTSSAVGVGSSSIPPLLLRTSGTAAAFVADRADTAGAVFSLGKSRSATIGGVTLIENNDTLGDIRFAGADGVDLESYGASITASVDGTPGANDIPGRLVFATTADGAASPTERLRITSAGVLQIADAGNIQVGTTTGTKIGTATTQKIGFFDKTPVVQPTAVADATDAASVITQLNALLTRMRNLGLIAT